MASIFGSLFPSNDSVPLPAPDPRQSAFDAQGNPRQLTYVDMLRHIMRNPETKMAWTPQTNFDYLQNIDDRTQISRILGETGAVGDPFGAIQIQRLLGYSPPNRVLINESHGLANKEQQKHY